MNYGYGCQQPRSEREQKLPEGIREQLDWARSGYSPTYPHTKITWEEAQRFVRLWLSEDNPGCI